MQQISNVDSRIIVTDNTGRQVIHDLGKETAINMNNYLQEFVNQPELYGKWVAMYTTALKQQRALEEKLNYMHAKLYNKTYKELVGGGAKRPTKDMVDAIIILNEDYHKVSMELADAESLADTLKLDLKVFDHRKDMLIQYGAAMRKDVENGN